MHSLVVLRGGEPVVQAWCEPYRASDRQLVYSVSKTVTGSAIGLLIGEGRLALDSLLVDLVGPCDVAPRTRQLTVHHLLSMSTGHTADTLADLRGWDVTDPLAHFLAVEPQRPVGSLHAYHNGASWVLGELVRRLSGESLSDYLRPRLFDPLDLDPTWDADSHGRELGYSGVHLTTAELARLGELYRCGGRWRGSQLLPADYVARATSLQVPTVDESPEWSFGYGYQLWLSRAGYRLDGAYGQYALVLPERELVVAITSAQASGSQPLLDAVFSQVDALSQGSASPAPALPVPHNDGTGTAWQYAGRVPLDPSLAPDLAEQEPPDLADVSLLRSGDGWTLALRIDGDPVRLRTGGDGWQRSSVRTGHRDVPVALAVGATAGVATVVLCFTDTPHSLVLELRAATAGVSWRTMPLEGPRVAGLVAR